MKMKLLYLANLLSATLIGVSAHAQVAQEPLLNRPNSVAPNLVLILDASGSMAENYIYSYGSSFSAWGMSGPSTLTYAQFSPDVNRLYYDPRVRYVPRIDYLGNALAFTTLGNSTSWKVYFRNTAGPYTSGGSVLSDYYNPSYTPATSVVVSGSTASYPNSVSSATSTYPKFLNRTDCAGASACTWAEELRNYSIWSQYYKTRIEMVKTGIGAAFQPLKNDVIRLGYGTISQLDGGNLQTGVTSLNAATGGSKSTFFSWLYGLNANSSTPNQTAVDNVGKYYTRTDSDGPWATTPNPNSTGISTTTATGPGKAESPANHASCRRSFSMLVTDGYYNGSQPTTAGNADNTGFSIKPAVGPSFVYTPGPPYSDNVSNTLADIVMYYWGRDLRTDLANRVPIINSNGINNPSTWQNVSFYAVTLGIDGTLPRTAATLSGLKAGTIGWPTPQTNNPTTVDDTWHATINGRGEMLNAGNAQELTAGLNKMFTTIAGLPQTLSGVAVSSTFLKNGTRKYKPEYVPGLWTGRLSAIELDPTTGNDKVPQNVFWAVEQGQDTNGDPISTIPAPNSRNVYTWNGSTALAFNATNTGLATDLVAYILGDPSKELRKPGGTWRNRDAKLGDIVNSSPAYIKDSLDMSYESLLPSGSFGDYRAFYNAKAARANGVLFVGANDGMLHGFRDSDGVEIFAYVPQAVQSNLNKLTLNPYVHQYFVDGPLVESDAYNGSVWRNLLLGTAGAGAKAVFALDVTDPLTMTASNVLWEINSSTTSFGNLGHVLSDVQTGILKGGQWVAIFGNGFGSSTGAASLFVVDLLSGGLLKEIPVDTTGGNGLGGVRVVRDANQRILGAYAGDLKGRMWKFDLSGSTSGSWGIGLTNAPLYTTPTGQPITAAPAIIPHPSGGYVVTFGGGKFFELTDTQSPYTTQRLYGIWDAQVSTTAFDTSPTATGASLSGITQLTQQTITPVTVSGTTYYRISTNAITWGNGSNSGTRGWYIDLPNSGERTVYPIQSLIGSFVLATTISPVSSAATDQCIQTGSGSGWAYIINGLTGAGPTKPVIDTNGDRVVDGGDALVSGWQDPVDGRPTPITIESNSLHFGGCVVTAQSTCTYFDIKCGQPGALACPPSAANGLKSREWRQLFMR